MCRPQASISMPYARCPAFSTPVIFPAIDLVAGWPWLPSKTPTGAVQRVHRGVHFAVTAWMAKARLLSMPDHHPRCRASTDRHAHFSQCMFLNTNDTMS